MCLTTQLVKQSTNTVLADFQDGLKLDELLRNLARETFNCTYPIVCVDDESQFKVAIKIAISAKNVKPSDVTTLQDLISLSSDWYKEKLLSKMVNASKHMGSHIPKATSSCIGQGAAFFPTLPRLDTGITSASCDSGRHISGSVNGLLIAGFGLLASTYRIGDDEPRSMFERLTNEEPVVLELLAELGTDDVVIKELIDTAREQLDSEISNTVSQFHKQSFVNFNGNRITVSPIQSVNTSVSLKHAINNVFNNDARVNIKSYAAGGANSQNVSAINQDLGGSIPHLKAWIPSQNRPRNVFNFVYRTKQLKLNAEQKLIINRLALAINRVESKGSSNLQDRKVIENTFSSIASLFIRELSDFVDDVNNIDDQSKLLEIAKRLNGEIKAYLTATSIKDKTVAAEYIALELLTKISIELKRNELNVHIEDSALKTIISLLNKEDLSCQSL